MKRILRLIVLAVFFLAGIAAYFVYNAIFKNNISSEIASSALYIDKNDQFENLIEKMQGQQILENTKSFRLASRLMSFGDASIRPGRYAIDKKMTNRQLINMLRSGRQSPVKITFNNVRTLENLSGKITKNIKLDSLGLLEYMRNEKEISSLGFNQQTLMTAFIPNTYQVYWDISAEDLVKRMKKEHDKWWTDKRLEQAKALNLSQKEVYTLASIVDRESLLKKEKPIIAGVYLNRLKRNIALQADPTVVFAWKKFDLRRVLNKHLEIDSPYNTYKYAGLPPGPIGMASISGLEAVLNPKEHNYIFFCAKPNGNGEHAFAKTLSGHNKNARKYQRWLNTRGIR